jgi:phage shock protein B
VEEIIVAPLIIFMVIVAPIWLVLHYRSKRQVNQGLSEEEYLQLTELSELADKMSDRIQTLEAILDAESPEWRKRVED